MVKCADCGFLSLRNQYTGTLDEAPEGFRADGAAPSLRDRQAKGVQSILGDMGYMFPWEDVPICFARAFPLVDEVRWDQGNVIPEAVKEAVEKPRKCPPAGVKLGFTKWSQGFTPKEHRDIMDRERMLRWQRIELAVIGVAVPLLIIGATIAGAFIERGSLFRDRPSVIDISIPTPPVADAPKPSP